MLHVTGRVERGAVGSPARSAAGRERVDAGTGMLLRYQGSSSTVRAPVGATVPVPVGPVILVGGLQVAPGQRAGGDNGLTLTATVSSGTSRPAGTGAGVPQHLALRVVVHATTADGSPGPVLAEVVERHRVVLTSEPVRPVDAPRSVVLGPRQAGALGCGGRGAGRGRRRPPRARRGAAPARGGVRSPASGRSGDRRRQRPRRRRDHRALGVRRADRARATPADDRRPAPRHGRHAPALGAAGCWRCGRSGWWRTPTCGPAPSRRRRRGRPTRGPGRRRRDRPPRPSSACPTSCSCRVRSPRR
nr:hypothetical protein [Angustibacter aerolatus]